MSGALIRTPADATAGTPRASSAAKSATDACGLHGQARSKMENGKSPEVATCGNVSPSCTLGMLAGIQCCLCMRNEARGPALGAVETSSVLPVSPLRVESVGENESFLNLPSLHVCSRKRWRREAQLQAKTQETGVPA